MKFLTVGDLGLGRTDGTDRIGSLHDPVTWYKITYTGEQVAQWDFQNNAIRTSPPGLFFVFPLRTLNLLTSICNFVPCDRIVQRAYWRKFSLTFQELSSLNTGFSFSFLFFTGKGWGGGGNYQKIVIIPVQQKHCRKKMSCEESGQESHGKNNLGTVSGFFCFLMLLKIHSQPLAHPKKIHAQLR